MKSTTLRRSNLSKEKMAVLEALKKYRSEEQDSAPCVYIRPEELKGNKQNELDLLWQNFKFHDFSSLTEKTPKLYIASGIAAGVLLVGIFSMTAFFAHNVSKSTTTNSSSIGFIAPSDEDLSTKTEKYIVQSGDTIEKILIRFYGQYSKTSEYNVMQANNLTNPNKLSIGQELIIPMQ